MSIDELKTIYGRVEPVEFIRATDKNCVRRTKDFLESGVLCVLNVSGSMSKRDALLQELYKQAELAAEDDFDGYVSGSYSDDSKNFEATLSLKKD